MAPLKLALALQLGILFDMSEPCQPLVADTRLEDDLDTNEQSQQRSQTDQHGSEIRSVEL